MKYVGINSGAVLVDDGDRMTVIFRQLTGKAEGKRGVDVMTRVEINSGPLEERRKRQIARDISLALYGVGVPDENIHISFHPIAAEEEESTSPSPAEAE